FLTLANIVQRPARDSDYSRTNFATSCNKVRQQSLVECQAGSAWAIVMIRWSTKPTHWHMRRCHGNRLMSIWRREHKAARLKIPCCEKRMIQKVRARRLRAMSRRRLLPARNQKAQLRSRQPSPAILKGYPARII